MAAKNEYRLYRKNSSGAYVAVRFIWGEAELYPETGRYPRRVSTVLPAERAHKVLAGYTFTGVTLPRCRLLRSGTLLLRPAGGFMLCLEYFSREDTCSCIESEGGRGCMTSAPCGQVFDMIVSGELVTTPDSAGNEVSPPDSSNQPETGRFYGVGDCFFTVFNGAGKELLKMYPQNGWFDCPIEITSEVFSQLLAEGAVKAVEGPLFRIKGQGQLLPVLNRYKQFEHTDTGKVIAIDKVSSFTKAVVPDCISYNELVTRLCNKSLVPYMDFHF